MSFWDLALPYARQASAATGVHTSVILAQWADETGYRWPAPGNNPGNVGNPQHGGQTNYATLVAGVQAYIHTMMLGYYVHVRAPGTADEQATALGQSPWAASHYGSPPGSVLLAIIAENGLTAYDGTTPAPPSPPPEELMGFACLISDGLLHVFGEVNGVAYHWFQPNPFPVGHTPVWNVEILPTPA